MEGPPLAKRQIRNRGALTIELSLVELRFPSYRGGGGALAGTRGPWYLYSLHKNLSGTG